jgi:hypothetical protein
MRLRTVLMLVAGLCALAPLLPPPAEAASGRSPLELLPAGRAPLTVPYAIGTSVFYHGHRTELRARFDQAFPGTRFTPAQRQLTTVVGGDRYAWAQLTGSAADVVHIVGRISPRGGWSTFHTSTGSFSRVSVTTAGTVVMPESGHLFSPDGHLIATFAATPWLVCGACAPSAAGRSVVVQKGPPGPGIPAQGTWLWTPPAAPRRLPDGYRALGRGGAGWLGAPDGAGCWRVAPVGDPTATRARICSQTLPLVSADGTRAVIVQSRQLRVVDTRTGAGISRARLAPLRSWTPPGTGTPVRYVVPVAWESADRYLAVARDDRILAIVRCWVTTTRCERAVRTRTGTGVDRIVTERGTQEITSP